MIREQNNIISRMIYSCFISGAKMVMTFDPSNVIERPHTLFWAWAGVTSLGKPSRHTLQTEVWLRVVSHVGKSEGWCDAARGPTQVCARWRGPGVWTGFGVLGEALRPSAHLLHVKKTILTRYRWFPVLLKWKVTVAWFWQVPPCYRFRQLPETCPLVDVLDTGFHPILPS